MKALSEQLNELSERSKKTEDLVAAARERNRAKLEARRAALTTSIAATGTRAEQRVAATGDAVQDTWNRARDSVDQRFTTLRAAADQRRAGRDLKHAEHRAVQAEQDAADAIDLALYVLDQAECAVIDAAIARADADELALENS
jgi:hypothetical protein